MFRERPVSVSFNFTINIIFSFFFVHFHNAARGESEWTALIGRNFKFVCESFFFVEREPTIFNTEKRNTKKMSETLRRMRHQSLSEGKVRNSSSSFIVCF